MNVLQSPHCYIMLHECGIGFNSKDLHSKYWQIKVKHIVYCSFVTKAHLESDVMNYTSASSINGNDPLDSVLCIESILGRSTNTCSHRRCILLESKGVVVL